MSYLIYRRFGSRLYYSLRKVITIINAENVYTKLTDILLRARCSGLGKGPYRYIHTDTHRTAILVLFYSTDIQKGKGHLIKMDKGGNRKQPNCDTSHLHTLCIHTHTYVDIHTHIYTHIHTHIHTYTHIHAYIHTHIQHSFI